MKIHRNGPRRARAVSRAACTIFAAGCAGATVGSGVGDRYFEQPPYYAGTGLPDTAEVAHLPVAYQAGATQPVSFDPSGAEGSAVAALLHEMNAYLDSLALTRAVEIATAPPARAPDVYFGCDTDGADECLERDAAEDPQLRLAVGRPSAEWTAWAQSAFEAADADYVLLITLEISQYWPHQRNLLGAKEVRLGTQHTQGVPWLTSLDDPVSVLQLTGAAIGRDGRAARIGAEGLVANQTNLLLSAIGAQELISDEDVERLRSAVREDLPGRPLVWKVALRNLVEQLAH